MTSWQDQIRAMAKPRGVAIPPKFVDFCNLIQVDLTPGQLAFASVAFDGAQIDDLSGDVRDLAIRLFGKIAEIPRKARNVVCAVCGGRAGKSYLCSLRLCHLAFTVSLHTLAPGEEATGLIVAPDMNQSKHTLDYVKGVMREKLPQYIHGEPTAEHCKIKRPDGKVVDIQCLAASKGGSAIRGRSMVGALLEECAFFRSDKYVVNDAEIFRAVGPRVLTGGQVMLPSTPWAEEGLLYEFFSRNHENPTDAVAAHAPTLLWRDNQDTREYVERERARDPENAKREFDAEFMSSAASQFFATRAIENAAKLWTPPEKGPRSVFVAGGDFAFSLNSSALVITARDPERYTVHSVNEKKPDGMPLRPSDVVRGFADIMKPLGLTELMADSHYRESVSEHLDEHGMLLIPAPEGAGGKSETYVKARQMLHQGLLLVPPDQKLIRQLREVKARPTSGGQLSIQSPVWRTGEHGDLVSALVLSVWAASLAVLPDEEPVVEVGTAAFYERRERERRARQQARIDADNDPEDSDWILGPG